MPGPDTWASPVERWTEAGLRPLHTTRVRVTHDASAASAPPTEARRLHGLVAYAPFPDHTASWPPGMQTTLKPSAPTTLHAS